MRIDAHTHAQPPRFLEALRSSGRYETAEDADGHLVIKERGSRFLTITPQMADAAQRVEEMDATGIDVQIISVTTPQVYFLAGQECVDLTRHCNDYLADIVQRYPERFRALASLPLTASMDDTLRELNRGLDELNMAGVIIGANIDHRPIDDPSFNPLYEEMNRRGTPMFIHPMVPAGAEVLNQYALAPLVGFMFDTTLAVARLIFSDFFSRFPNINVMVGHLGGAVPYLAGRLDIGYRSYPDCQGIDQPPSEIMKKLYLDTVSFYEPALRCALETVGPEHIVFGSDYPHVIGDVKTAVETIEHTTPPSAHAGILGDNAARLFGIES